MKLMLEQLWNLSLERLVMKLMLERLRKLLLWRQRPLQPN